MIHSFKFRYGGRSMFCFYDTERNTLEIGKSCRGNMIVDVVCVDWALSYNVKMSLIAHLSSPDKCLRASSRKYFFQLWRINFMFNR